MAFVTLLFLQCINQINNLQHYIWLCAPLLHILCNCVALWMMQPVQQSNCYTKIVVLYWFKAMLHCCVAISSWISKKKRGSCPRKKLKRGHQSLSCFVMILTLLWILRGVKVKNCHQVSHWLQLALSSAKSPLSILTRIDRQAPSISLDHDGCPVRYRTRLATLFLQHNARGAWPSAWKSFVSHRRMIWWGWGAG